MVAILTTLGSKGPESRHICDELRSAGAQPWVLDLSLRPHSVPGADVDAIRVADVGGSDLTSIAALDRGTASRVMIAGARRLMSTEISSGRIHAALGIGGANGTSMSCAVMRVAPLHFPKLMVSAVAATGAVKWYVGGSDIVMFPSVGDFGVNRVTSGVFRHAATAATAMAEDWLDSLRNQAAPSADFVAISSFGGTSACVSRVQDRLESAGFEVAPFHASGPGGRALEQLARSDALDGIVDITTHELTDLMVGGTYSAGNDRLRGAAEQGIPQVVVPGSLDHANFWVGEVPDRFRDREFIRYNEHNLLMRTNANEFESLAHLVASRLNRAIGPVTVLIPSRGFSEHTPRETVNLDGDVVGSWNKPDVDFRFADVLTDRLRTGTVRVFDMHINDREFADECVSAFLEVSTIRSPDTDHNGEAAR